MWWRQLLEFHCWLFIFTDLSSGNNKWVLPFLQGQYTEYVILYLWCFALIVYTSILFSLFPLKFYVNIYWIYLKKINLLIYILTFGVVVCLMLEPLSLFIIFFSKKKKNLYLSTIFNFSNCFLFYANLMRFVIPNNILYLFKQIIVLGVFLSFTLKTLIL